MLYKAIIFDVDGTLIDNEELHREAFNRAFREFGLDWVWGKDIYRDLLLIGGGKERIQHFQQRKEKSSFELSKSQVFKLHAVKKNFYENSLESNTITLRNGVQQLISQARIRGVNLAIATASSLSSVERLCSLIWGLPVEKIFDQVTSGDGLINNKPAPEVYLATLEKLGLGASECVAIEDSRTGMLAARGAGLTTIVTPSSYTSNDDFSEANFICKSVEKKYLPKKLQIQLFG